MYIGGIGKTVSFGIHDYNRNLLFHLIFLLRLEQADDKIPRIPAQITVGDCDRPEKNSQQVIILLERAMTLSELFLSCLQCIQSAKKPGEKKNQFHGRKRHLFLPVHTFVVP